MNTTEIQTVQTTSRSILPNQEVLHAIEAPKAGRGVVFANMNEVIQFAKMMACSGAAVPPHLRSNPGLCLAVVIQAIGWGMNPYAVASQTYVINDKLSYQTQLVHAVLLNAATLRGRMRHHFIDEGPDRRCVVWCIDETGQKLEHISPPIGAIQPKNSPLWRTKPDLQLYYNTVRDFVRIYYPDVLLGVYADDEMKDSPRQPETPEPQTAPASRSEALAAALRAEQSGQPAGEQATEEPIPTQRPPDDEAGELDTTLFRAADDL